MTALLLTNIKPFLALLTAYGTHYAKEIIFVNLINCAYYVSYLQHLPRKGI